MDNISSEERSKRARAYFKEGYNCCQAVLLAFQDIIGLPEVKIAGLSSGFGGGMGRLREVCGAFSAMTFMAGVICPADDPSKAEGRRENYALVQEFADKFRKENGSIICREQLQLRASQKESPTPSVRDEHWYAVRPCERLVGSSARLIAEKLKESEI